VAVAVAVAVPADQLRGPSLIADRVELAGLELTLSTGVGVDTVQATGPGGVGPGVHVVFDPDDSWQCVQELTGLHDVLAGRVVCHLSPGASRRAHLAVDLLTALGKRHDGVQIERLGHQSWELVRTWLLGERARHLVVLRAHLLSAQRWSDLLELAATTRVSLWLVCHQPQLVAAQQAVLAGRSWVSSSWQDAVTMLIAAPFASGAGAGVVGADEWPAVPHADFPVFRSAAVRLLEPAAFARVDAVYRATVEATRVEALDWRLALSPATPASALDDRAELGAVLQRLTVDATGSAEVLTRLRAVQAGFFCQGLLLRLHLGPGHPRLVTSLAPRLDPATVRRLRLVVAPSLAGALVVAVATDCDATTLAGLCLDHVADDGDRVRLRARWYRVPPRAAGLVRAALLEHLARHPDAEAVTPLFAAGRGKWLSPQAMAALVSRAAGLAGSAHPVPRLPPPGKGPRPRSRPVLRAVCGSSRSPI
jgi:hypothetical protein